MTVMASGLPELVRRAGELAAGAGFMMSCDTGTGQLLATLAAAVPPGGRVLELGTGTGVGTAWVVHGLQGRNDVVVRTVELDPTIAELATRNRWPDWVEIVTGDALDVTTGSGTFNLIFADAPGGKWDGLDRTIAALRPCGHLLVDDMTPRAFVDEHHALKTGEVRDRLLAHPDLVSVEIGWSTGLILSTRRRDPDE
jgi:demethylmenaquinone methyltransferase/2-methoxy-6-polyprenyl-1,4-benzoquinol methylase